MSVPRSVGGPDPYGAGPPPPSERAHPEWRGEALVVAYAYGDSAGDREMLALAATGVKGHLPGRVASSEGPLTASDRR